MSMIKKRRALRAAVVGAGNIADLAHFPAWQAAKRGKAVVIVDPDVDRAKKMAEKWGIKEWETDYQKILDREDIDIVDLCLPHHLHYEYVRQAAEAGKHIMVEKPIANSLSEAEKMVKVAKENKVKFMVAEHWRFVPIHLQAQEDIKNGYVGKVFMVKSEHLNYSRAVAKKPLEWAQKIETAGFGALMGVTCHNISLLRMLFGRVESVFATRSDRVTCKWLDPRIDLNAIAILRFENGILGEVTASMTTRCYSRFHTWIYGDKGTIYMDMVRGEYQLFSEVKKRSRRRIIYRRKNINQSTAGFNGEIQYLINCIINDKEPRQASGEDEKETFRVALAGYQSIKDGREVKLSKVKW